MTTSYESTTTRMAQAELGACTLIQDLLPLYLEGEVTPASRELIAEHMARCERCAGFLAGAQSVRTQLRAETTQRQQATQHDQPWQLAVSAGQRITSLTAIIVLYAIGAQSSSRIIDSLQNRELFEFIFQSGVGLACVAGLMILARNNGPLTPVRLLSLVSNSILGSIGTMLVFYVGLRDYNFSSPIILIGAMLVLLALISIWYTVEQRAPKAAPQGS